MMPKLPNMLGRLLCWLGLHDYQIIDRSFDFGSCGDTEKVQCRRCRQVIIRKA